MSKQSRANVILRPAPEAKPTYSISADGASILCLKCNMRSYYFADVEHKYCGYCHEFHAD